MPLTPGANVSDTIRELHTGKTYKHTAEKQFPLKRMSNEELAYIAGIFDGEGCVNFTRVKGNHYIRVMVVNTNLSLLKYLKECFGGDIKAKLMATGWKQSYTWRLSWSKAIKFLELIEPWLRVKEDQAHLAFCWNHFRPGPGRDQEKREEYASVMGYLRECLTYFNRRGIHNLEDPIKRELDHIEWVDGEHAP